MFDSSTRTLFIVMAKSTTNLFELSFNEINARKKQDLVSKIEKLKGKVVVDNNMKNFCDQVSCLSENLTKLMESNEKLSQFIVVKKVNTLLEKPVIELEKSQAKAEQYSWRNNVAISGIPHEILDNNLEDKVIDICKDAGIEIGHMDIEGCHRLPLSRNNAGDTKCVIVKFVNRKHSEDMLRLKIASSRSKVFNSNLLFLIFGASVKTFNEEVSSIRFSVLVQLLP